MSEIAPIAHNILFYGRGSIPAPDGAPDGARLLSEMGKARVDTIKEYIVGNYDQLDEDAMHGTYDGTVRVLLSAGWAAGEGQPRPPMKYREANLAARYAEEIGLTGLRGDYFRVLIGKQPSSCSTISDGVYAARGGFFGQRPFNFSRVNPLAVVAQRGPNNKPGHMGRCIDATRRAFQIGRSAIMPLVAAGEDVPGSGMSEGMTTMITRAATLPFQTHDGLLTVDRAMIKVSLAIQARTGRGKIVDGTYSG